MALFLDIETIANKDDAGYLAYKTENISAPSNYKDPEKIAKYVEEQKQKQMGKLALSPLTGKMVLAGLALSDSSFTDGANIQIADAMLSVRYCGFDGRSEAEIVADTLKTIAQYMDNGQVLVSYNGKSFDLPFLFQRAMILGIDKPERLLPLHEFTSKYSKIHYDLFDWLNPAYGSFSTLREWSYLMRHTDDLNDSGGSIEQMFCDGDFDAIKQKNKRDLLKTFMLFNAIKGWMI